MAWTCCRTPVFLNPTLLGAMPGYYNSAYGITATVAPTINTYVSYGIYDGNLARGEQTGLNLTPEFNGYYFMIGEVGYA
jgi:porin